MARFVGLTGGIGSGKSTVARMLVERGAELIDADAIVHELQAPGTEVFEEIVQAFGPEVVTSEGTLDRGAVAELVFADPAKLQRLNAITHPRVGARMAERVAELADTDALVILDVPLLGASKEGSASLADAVIVVTAGEAVRLERLAARGMDPSDAKQRMSNQITDEERVAMADHVVTNDGTLEELEEQVDALWTRLRDAT